MVSSLRSYQIIMPCWKNPQFSAKPTLAERTRPRIIVSEIRWCAIGVCLRRWLRLVTKLVSSWKPSAHCLELAAKAERRRAEKASADATADADAQ